jgi:hypothetical protein
MAELANAAPAVGPISGEEIARCNAMANAIAGAGLMAATPGHTPTSFAGTVADAFRELRARSVPWASILAEAQFILDAIAAGGGWSVVLSKIIAHFFPTNAPAIMATAGDAVRFDARRFPQHRIYLAIVRSHYTDWLVTEKKYDPATAAAAVDKLSADDIMNNSNKCGIKAGVIGDGTILKNLLALITQLAPLFIQLLPLILPFLEPKPAPK